jgi:hypothetical protein
LGFLLSHPLAAQAITPGRTVTISADAPADPHGESFLAVNPKNPKNQLAAVCRISKGKMGTSAYVTHDGGLHWTRVTPPESAAKVSTGWDAIAYFDGQGTAYYGANDGDGLYITRSTDEGRTWSAATLIPDGTAVLPFMTISERNFPSETTLWEPQDPNKPQPDYDMALRLAVSGDGGSTYSISPPVRRFRMSGDRFRATNVQGVGNTVIDLSNGPFRGRIYHVGLDNAGDRHNVTVIHSSDNGKTWSKPVTVNDNANPADHANPTIAVNNRGVVGVVWNDRRRHKNECYDLHFSASLDGGDTFLPSVTPGGKPTCSIAKGNWAPNAEVSAYPRTEDGESIEGQGFNVLMISTRFPGGGDTQGLDSDGDGVFHAAWIDGSSGVMQLATTPFTVRGAATTTEKTERDVTTQVKLVAENCGFDWKESAFACQMHLVNKSPLPVTGPFVVELQNMRVNLTDFKVDNADNKKTAEGARWNFAGPSRVELAPGAATAARSFRWRFTGIPERPEYPFMMFKIVSSGANADRDVSTSSK